jgi:ribonuclease D
LRAFFANTAICKVMHGADHDVRWLQRDYGVQIHNLCDTGQAMRLLGYERHSLGHLFEHHLGMTVDKARFQRADWRERPLGKVPKIAPPFP